MWGLEVEVARHLPFGSDNRVAANKGCETFDVCDGQRYISQTNVHSKGIQLQAFGTPRPTVGDV